MMTDDLKRAVRHADEYEPWDMMAGRPLPASPIWKPNFNVRVGN